MSAGLEAIETASRDELTALQLSRLRWSLEHAYTHVPHYRKAFDAAGVHPADLRTLADLAHFPFTGKADLRDNYPFGMFAVPGRRCPGSMPRPAPPAGRRWSATPPRTSTPGPT
jgi:phenylacetate-CoA ligase